MTKYSDTDSVRRATVAMLKSGQASIVEAAKLAGVSKQLATRWIQVERNGKRTFAFDWKAARESYLGKTWAKRLAKEKSAVAALR